MISLTKFERLARTDFEFTREIRYFTGVVKVVFPRRSVVLSFADGQLLAVDEASPPDSACKIVIRGDHPQWAALLQDKPRPFFQSLQSASVKHGLSLSAGDATFAYLPALNRMTSLLRMSRSEEALA